MSTPVLIVFNNKGVKGRTSLTYHLAWTLAEAGKSVLIGDLDPQTNLTAAFLMAAVHAEADIVLVHIRPNLGAINRSALINGLCHHPSRRRSFPGSKSPTFGFHLAK